MRAGQDAVAWSTTTVTRAFLFTDIESSTRRWEGDTDAMALDLARHDALLRAAVNLHGGELVAHTGDGVCAGFPTSAMALAAALDAQRALLAESWVAASPLRVRMGVHVGAVQSRDGNYFGPTLNRTARLMSVGAGGQVLCSQVAAELAVDRLPAGVDLLDLGEHRLADLARSEQVYQLAHPELLRDFPALKSAVGPRHNLPAAPGQFLGRAAELDELEQLLATHRLITLWGPGGAGKTRLSLELAARGGVLRRRRLVRRARAARCGRPRRAGGHGCDGDAGWFLGRSGRRSGPISD